MSVSDVTFECDDSKGVIVVYDGKKLFGNSEVFKTPELTPQKLRLIQLIHKDIQHYKSTICKITGN